jgi:hypothetical protein
MMVDDFSGGGDIILAPGTALFLAGTTATGGATDVSLTWVETPLTNI